LILPGKQLLYVGTKFSVCRELAAIRMSCRRFRFAEKKARTRLRNSERLERKNPSIHPIVPCGCFNQMGNVISAKAQWIGDSKDPDGGINQSCTWNISPSVARLWK
jgi:hypothetical protein